MGKMGDMLAIIGVVACPITSGDTTFRSARLILAEWTGLKQDKLKNRLILTLPLLTIGAVLTQVNFNVLWRYFSWSNQTLAMIALWCAAAYFIKNGKSLSFLLPALPGTFMTAVSNLHHDDKRRFKPSIFYCLSGWHYFSFCGFCVVLHICL